MLFSLSLVCLAQVAFGLKDPESPGSGQMLIQQRRIMTDKEHLAPNRYMASSAEACCRAHGYGGSFTEARCTATLFFYTSCLQGDETHEVPCTCPWYSACNYRSQSVPQLVGAVTHWKYKATAYCPMAMEVDIVHLADNEQAAEVDANQYPPDVPQHDEEMYFECDMTGLDGENVNGEKVKPKQAKKTRLEVGSSSRADRQDYTVHAYDAGTFARIKIGKFGFRRIFSCTAIGWGNQLVLHAAIFIAKKGPSTHPLTVMTLLDETADTLPFLNKSSYSR